MRYLWHKPSPAMVVAMAAFVVALGGVAFATIPDSSGRIHGCVGPGNGQLRVVESAVDCHKNERSISWNEQGPPGPPGGGVVARMRSGPVVVPPPGEPFIHDIPLSNNTWEQGPDEFQRIEVEFVYSEFGCNVRINVVVDGEVLQAFDYFQNFGRERNVSFDLPLFDTGSARTHTLTMQVTRDTNCRTIDSVKVDVLGFE
jgi:hypothetical protein